jgi:outer membrane usher protein FimD/PapC
MSLYASASATRSTDTTYGFFVGLNFSLDKNIRGAASYNKTGGADTETVQIQKDIPVGEGLGYRASLTRSALSAEAAYSFNPFLQYNASYGTFAVDSNIRNATGRTHEQYSASAAGALVYAGGFYGISRPVNDSFGIVMVDSLPNTAVLNNGQELGKTGVSGTMVIPSLASYNQNQITVDTKNIPLNYSISGVNAVLSPSLWSGSCVAFDARKVQAVTGTLYVKKSEKAVPLEYHEITMKVGERMVTFPTGKGGEFYVENSLPDDTTGAMDKRSCQAIAELRKSGGNAIMPGTYQASAEYEGKKCVFLMIFPGKDDEIADLGEIQCMLSPAPVR